MPTPAARRGPVRRFLEVRGVVGGIPRTHLTTWLRTADGVRLAASYLAGPPAAITAVVLAHGFAAHRRKPAYARLATALAARSAVLSVDLRGHGQSGGVCTLGDAEAADVEAAVGWLQRFGHHHVVACGVSMGGTGVLHAAARGAPIAGLVTVSAPAFFRDPPETRPLQQLDAVWRSPARRWALRAGLGVHLSGPESWGGLAHPIRLASEVDVPYLVVHGADDAYFPATDALALAEAAASRSGRATTWIEPAGFGHAEDGFRAGFNQRLGDAIAALAA